MELTSRGYPCWFAKILLECSGQISDYFDTKYIEVVQREPSFDTEI